MKTAVHFILSTVQVRETGDCRKEVKKSVDELADTVKADKKELKDKVKTTSPKLINKKRVSFAI